MEWLKSLYEWCKKIKESLIEGIDPEKITEEQEFNLIKGLIEDETFPPKFDEKVAEENGSFLAATFDRLIEMIKGNKSQEAVQMLQALKEKMSKYGYPSVSKYYGYPKDQGAKETEEQKKAREAKEAEAKKAKEAEEARQKQMTEMQKVQDELNKMKEDTAKSKCEAMLTEALATSKLPEPVQEKIRKNFSGKIFTKESLDEWIKTEREVLSKLSESGNINGLGETKVEVLRAAEDKLMVAMDKMIDDEADVDPKFKDVPGFTSLKESYRTFHPEDPKVTGTIDRRKHLNRLTEAITSGDFTYALGTSMTRKLVREYKKKAFIFEPIVTEVPVDNFKQQERVRWGGYSTLPTVTEDSDYTDLYEPKDEEATYTPTTKGGYVSVSRKTIKNDDLGLVRRIPNMVQTAAKKSLERFVANLLLANGTYTVTNTTVFSTTFGNYSTFALSYDTLTDREDAMLAHKERGAAQDSGTATAGASTTLTDSAQAWTTNEYANYYVRLVYGTGAGQTRLISSNTATQLTVSVAWTTNPSTDTKYEVSTVQNDDEEIGNEAKYLIHGRLLRAKVKTLMTSVKNPENEAEDNIHKGTLTPIYCPYITGSTYQYFWFLAASKDQLDMIEIGYVDNQKTPLLVIQDQPALGEVFTKDRLRWKVRHEYGGEIVDNKGLDANFATSG